MCRKGTGKPLCPLRGRLHTIPTPDSRLRCCNLQGPVIMTAPTYEKLTPPTSGTRVTVSAAGAWQIPDDPIVCLLRGDGIGVDVGDVPGITTCAVKVLDAAVAKAY